MPKSIKQPGRQMKKKTNDKGFHYCNFCKYYVPSAYGAWRGGCIKQAHTFPLFFRQQCDVFVYSLITDHFGIETPEYFIDWIDARNIHAELTRDIRLFKNYIEGSISEELYTKYTKIIRYDDFHKLPLK